VQQPPQRLVRSGVPRRSSSSSASRRAIAWVLSRTSGRRSTRAARSAVTQPRPGPSTTTPNVEYQADSACQHDPPYEIDGMVVKISLCRTDAMHDHVQNPEGGNCQRQEPGPPAPPRRASPRPTRPPFAGPLATCGYGRFQPRPTPTPPGP
jgi:hypothetical protein